MQKELQQFNAKGWIPGPKEEKKSFLARIEALEHFFSYPPEDIDHFLTDRDWAGTREVTKYLYDFSSDWIVAYYSDQKLSFFQGAATWITEKDDLRIPLVQLKEKFEKGKLLGIYGRQEILAHEAVHAVRMQFDEPLFEEIFAYKTSPLPFRRLLGPIFQKPWEAYLFIGLLLIPMGVEIALFMDYPVNSFVFVRFAPLFFMTLLLIRLCFLQVSLVLAIKKLRVCLVSPQRALAVALRLKDREIFQFAYQSKRKLIPFLKGEESLRWKLLKENYFKKKLNID